MAAAIANGDTKLTVVIGTAGTTVASVASKTVACGVCGALPASTDDDEAVSAATSPPPPSPTTATPARHVQWLRAAVLGASDGLVSTAALMLGFGAARPADRRAVLVTGLAGLIAGACSMAIGEYVSVHAQRDVEVAELKRARAAAGGGGGATDDGSGLPSPGQAAAASALSFAAGAAVPLLAAWPVASYAARVAVVVATATVTLAVFGSLGAVLGRAPGRRAALRAVVGGLVAMGITYGLMKLFKT